MRISCPYCGARDLSEFSYLGDASPRRPHFEAVDGGASAAGVEDAFFDYVYMRDNPAGPIDEHWYHGGGCRSWLVVTRDTRTHEIASVLAASGAGARKGEGTS
jgi:methylglutamate dehydrogenase subunit B